MTAGKGGLMRSLLLAGLFLLLAAALAVAATPAERLVGEWTGTDTTGMTASFVFKDDGRAQMIQGEQVLDGTEVGGSFTWSLDSRSKPMQLDLTLTDAVGNTKVLPMIVRFLGNGSLQLRITDGMVERPTGFSEEDDPNQIILSKTR